jgi:TetR/AcrR family transcriptional regulator, transcriptional repressor for nem operon
MSKIEIIKKIEDLFFEKSFKEVSMQDIANDLGMKKASLYYYFPSKDILILEVLESSFNIYLEFINKTIEIWTNENFKELLKKFLYFPEKNKNIFSIINQN